MVSRWRILFPVAVPILVIVALSLFFSAKEKDAFFLGFVGELSGKFADLGIDCRRGVELAVAKRNAEGGVDGRMVELLARDDGHDAEQAADVIRSFLAMELPVVIGHTTSSMTMATLPLVNQSNTLLVSPTTSTPLLQDIDDNFIRTCAVSTDAALMLARYIREVQNVKRVGGIYDLSNSA